MKLSSHCVACGDPHKFFHSFRSSLLHLRPAGSFGTGSVQPSAGNSIRPVDRVLPRCRRLLGFKGLAEGPGIITYFQSVVVESNWLPHTKTLSPAVLSKEAPEGAPGRVFHLVSMAFVRLRAGVGLCAVPALFVAGLWVFRWGLVCLCWCLVLGLAGVPLWFPRRLRIVWAVRLRPCC